MKRIIIFLLLTFGITYSAEFYLMANGGMNSNFGMIWISLMMFIPAICCILTRLFTKEKFGNMYLKPHFKGNIKYYIFAWIGPAILTVIGGLIFFILFSNTFDPSMSTMEQTLIAEYEAANIDVSTLPAIQTLLISQLLLALLLGPILNFIPALGEELGWRGYLLPKLIEKMGNIKAIILTGIIWGLWHLPVIIMGHNYGFDYWGYPYLGIIGMILFCIFIGMFFAYLSIRTKSAIPCAIAHGALNAVAAVAIFFANGTQNVLFGPTPVGLVGGIGFIVTGIVCIVLLSKDKKKNIEQVKVEA